jgi:hypothetical protein
MYVYNIYNAVLQHHAYHAHTTRVSMDTASTQRAHALRMHIALCIMHMMYDVHNVVYVPCGACSPCVCVCVYIYTQYTSIYILIYAPSDACLHPINACSGFAGADRCG